MRNGYENFHLVVHSIHGRQDQQSPWAMSVNAHNSVSGVSEKHFAYWEPCMEEHN